MGILPGVGRMINLVQLKYVAMKIELVRKLKVLGMNEYEARVYVTLAGLKRASARNIHDASRVPRGRIYDILGDLTRRGFIGMITGSPNQYYILDPDTVFERLKEDYIATLDDVKETLKGTDFQLPGKNLTCFLKSDWAIENHITALLRETEDELVVLCNDPDFLRQYRRKIRPLTRKITLMIVVKDKEEYEGIDLPIVEARGSIRSLFTGSVVDGVAKQDLCTFLSDGKNLLSISSFGSETFAFVSSEMQLTRFLQDTIRDQVGKEREQMR
jgi:sugar-specific transcriptional regulator TrmB